METQTQLNDRHITALQWLENGSDLFSDWRHGNDLLLSDIRMLRLDEYIELNNTGQVYVVKLTEKGRAAIAPPPTANQRVYELVLDAYTNLEQAHTETATGGFNGSLNDALAELALWLRWNKPGEAE